MISGYLDAGQTPIAYENISVDNTIKNLTVPVGAKSALIVLIPDSTDTDSINAYFSEVSGIVGSGEGMPMNFLTNYIVRRGSLATFEITSANLLIHSLRVTYFG